MAKENIGMVLTTGTKMLGMDKNVTCYVELLTPEQTLDLVKKYKLKVKESKIREERTTSNVLMRDKKGEKEGVLGVYTYDDKDMETHTLTKDLIMGIQVSHNTMMCYC